MKKLVFGLLIWRNLFAIPIYLANQEKINLDMQRYLSSTPFSKPNIWALNYLLIQNKPFRSVFRYRINKRKHKILKIFLPKCLPGIEVYGEIDGGLLLFHNMGCVIAPYKAGKNLTVAQGVTIGKGNPNEEGRMAPILGDNVWVCTNAVVFGGITVGNNVKIGAGTVLNKSVPDNCTVVGNPARIIKRDGVPVDEML